MHLIENYALTLGQKIGKPYIIEHFYPLDTDKYICFQPYTKPAKTYDFWLEVISSLIPALNSKGIQILQLGSANERPMPGCTNLLGKTNIGNVAYILKNSLCHFGVDSFMGHVAGIYNRPLCLLYSTNYKECVSPYWGDKSKQILLEPDRTTRKPSFSFEENPKEINQIKPETIILSILQLLDFKNVKAGFESLYFGPHYTKYGLETVPDQAVDLQGLGTDSIIYRMDYLFNENNLVQQLQRSKVSLVTNKPINLDILNNFKERISEFVYVVDENDDSEFTKKASKIGFPFHLMSYLPAEQIQKKKINYIDVGVINHKNITKPKEVENIETSKLVFKTNKFLLSNGKIFLSKDHWKTNQPIESFAKNNGKVIDSADFWNESEHFYLLKMANS